jgi:hypothetical protein
LFQVLTSENWPAQMYSTMHATNSVAGAIYFVSLVFFGQYVILSLFLAILIENFQEASQEISNEIYHSLSQKVDDIVYDSVLDASYIIDAS